MESLPTEPRELAHEAPCLVTMLIILRVEIKQAADEAQSVRSEIILLVN